MNIGDVSDETLRELYTDLLLNASLELVTWIRLIEYGELFHILLVREISHNQDHDHSKDVFYRLVTNARFALLDGKKTVPDELEIIFKRECDRHYKTEAHHPEHENFDNQQCSDKDVCEMAHDRMARSAQMNNGEVKIKELHTFFLPKFPRQKKSEERRRQEIYMEEIQNKMSCMSSAYDKTIQKCKSLFI